MKILLSIILTFSGFCAEAVPIKLQVQTSFQEKTIHPKDLPENIRKYVTDNYNGAQITKATASSTDTNEKYTVFINFKQSQIVLKFDQKGEFVRKE